MKRPDQEMSDAIGKFLSAFETVFHYDYEYTKSMIGDEPDGETFIGCERNYEVEDWGARYQLLKTYRELKDLRKKALLGSGS